MLSHADGGGGCCRTGMGGQWRGGRAGGVVEWEGGAAARGKGRVLSEAW